MQCRQCCTAGEAGARRGGWWGWSALAGRCTGKPRELRLSRTGQQLHSILLPAHLCAVLAEPHTRGALAAGGATNENALQQQWQQGRGSAGQKTDSLAASDSCPQQTCKECGVHDCAACSSVSNPSLIPAPSHLAAGQAVAIHAAVALKHCSKRGNRLSYKQTGLINSSARALLGA
jgi:hypothetical protein